MTNEALRVATPLELAQAEELSRESVLSYMDAYLAFPTSDNFDLTLQRMRAYQSAWMNGRKRP